jgi:hypothetical protein
MGGEGGEAFATRWVLARWGGVFLHDEDSLWFALMTLVIARRLQGAACGTCASKRIDRAVHTRNRRAETVKIAWTVVVKKVWR